MDEHSEVYGLSALLELGQYMLVHGTGTTLVT